MNQELFINKSIVKVGSVKDYIQLTKPMLTFLVIMSSVVVYIWALPGVVSVVNVLLLGIGWVYGCRLGKCSKSDN